jgi:hypothetical protein
MITRMAAAFERFWAWLERRWGIEPNQCTGAVHSLSGSAPERCAYPAGHEGKCEP